MSSRLRNIRLSRSQLTLVAGLSALSTALIIATAGGRTAAQNAALAALRGQAVVVQPAAGRTSLPGAGASSTGPVAGQSPEATPPPAAPPAAPRTTTTTTSRATAGAGTGPATATPATTTAQTSPTTPTRKASKVRHVFVIALSSDSFEDAFGMGSPAHYLNGTLRRRGTLLGGYETLGAAELPDYLAMVGGQQPNADTRADCATYAEFPSGVTPGKGGLVPGDGCIYPNTVTTIGDQVTAAAHTWRAYLEDMGATACAHPDSGAPADAPLIGAGAQYDQIHNPFIYFHSLLDLGDCSSDDLTLQKLGAALRMPARKAPSYTFIAPGTCDDSSQETCPDGGPAGLAREDAFLKQWVPQILRSSAYRTDGALLIVFTHAAPPPAAGDPVSDRPIPIGALVLSRYAEAGKTIATVYNPYSVLRTIEDLLGFDPLARAATARSFARDALPGA